ncbi:hypothetical protein BH23GEM9_BH23GEM9_29560 [soil metagenome]
MDRVFSARKRFWLLTILLMVVRPTSGHGQDMPQISCVDLNTASDTALQRIAEVGPTRAAQIIEFRQHRRFHAVEDLRRISGISDARLLQIKAQGLACVSPPVDASTASDSAEAAGAISNEPTGPGCVDLNTASVHQLERIVQIGPARAAQIIQLRMSKPFVSLDDLSRVSGLSTINLVAIRQQGLACVRYSGGAD